MEGSCEYPEQAVEGSRHGVVLQLGALDVELQILVIKISFLRNVTKD
jgi:hypothetical protein